MDGVQNMSKYDKMIALNRKASDEKIEKARKEIFKMIDAGEKVTIPKLMQKTGLSRGFFYKNPAVRREMDRAMEQQVGMVDPKRYIGDLAMKHKIEMLQQQMAVLQRENENLKKENQKLKGKLEAKDLKFLKNL